MQRKVILFVAIAVAVTSFALPATAQSALDDAPTASETPGTPNGDDAGICQVGVDSPCNGEEWDGDGLPIDIPGIPW